MIMYKTGRVWRKTIDTFSARRKESSDEAKCIREVGHEFLLRKHIHSV